MMENITAVPSIKKVALITGGTSGIGKAVVEELASKGFSIAFTYNSNYNSAILLKNFLMGKAVDCECFKCDLSNEQEIDTLVKSVYLKFGRIDVLVNNAAYCKDELFYNKTADDFEKTLKINVVGTFLLSRLVGAKMHDNKYGRIINLASTNGVNTYFPMCIDYDASKSAVISLTHNLAIQFAPYVNVNSVAPGFIATENEIGGMDEEFIKMEEEKIMVRRVGLPVEVAKLIAFLISDDASFINNQVIKINGGIYGDE